MQLLNRQLKAQRHNFKCIYFPKSLQITKSFSKSKSDVQLTFLKHFSPLNSFSTINSEHNCAYASFLSQLLQPTTLIPYIKKLKLHLYLSPLHHFYASVFVNLKGKIFSLLCLKV